MEMPVVQASSVQKQPAPPRQEDIQELSAIVTHRLQYFQRIAMRQLGNFQDAEDAVQDALVSAFKHLGQFRGQAQMSTWLTTIVINSARMKARGLLRKPHISIDGCDQDNEYYLPSDKISDSRPDPEDLLRERELRDKVEHLSTHMSPVLRETFHLRTFEELSVRETATVLGVQETAVKARASRARAQLRRLLRGYECQALLEKAQQQNN